MNLNQPVYRVYWSPQVKSITLCKAMSFDADELGLALKFCEELRTRRRNGEQISFITLCSEDPNSVGQAGVDVTGPEYDWKKRRK